MCVYVNKSVRKCVESLGGHPDLPLSALIQKQHVGNRRSNNSPHLLTQESMQWEHTRIHYSMQAYCLN